MDVPVEPVDRLLEALRSSERRLDGRAPAERRARFVERGALPRRSCSCVGSAVAAAGSSRFVASVAARIGPVPRGSGPVRVRAFFPRTCGCRDAGDLSAVLSDKLEAVLANAVDAASLEIKVDPVVPTVPGGEGSIARSTERSNPPVACVPGPAETSLASSEPRSQGEQRHSWLLTVAVSCIEWDGSALAVAVAAAEAALGDCELPAVCWDAEQRFWRAVAGPWRSLDVSRTACTSFVALELGGGSEAPLLLADPTALEEAAGEPFTLWSGDGGRVEVFKEGARCVPQIDAVILRAADLLAGAA